MKKIKRILAMIMAFVMIMGMSTIAFAEEPTVKESATITIKNAADADQVSYMQVIKAAPTKDTGWDFTSDAVAKAYVDAFGIEYEDDTITDVHKQTAIVKLIKYVKEDATVHDEYATVTKADAAQIDTALASLPTDFTVLDAATNRKCLKGCDITACTHKDKECTVCGTDKECTCEVVWEIVVSDEGEGDDDAAGVYAIKGAETGYTYKVMAAYVGFGEVYEGEGEDETLIHIYPSLIDTDVTAKKSPTSIDKEAADRDQVVAVGDTVEYTIEAYVPFIDPVEFNDNRTFSITDKIKGASYDQTTGIKVEMKVGDTWQEVTDKVVAFENLANDENGFKEAFEITLDKLVEALDNPNAGNAIKVSYKVKVDAVEVINQAYSHVPGIADSGDSEKLVTGTIIFTKYGENQEVLAGAGFEVTSGSTTLKFTGSAGEYTYDPLGSVTEIFTGEDGTVTVKGLNIGDYIFTEKTAPKGYSINEDPVTVELYITEKANKDTDVATVIFEDIGSMTDTKLLALPSTGGIGTTIFTVAGCAIMIAAAGFFFASRKKEEE